MMPIQYQPFPEFQVPNLNLMGSFAQGAALANQQLQQEKLAQATDIAAAKAAQDAENARLKQQADELDFAVKNANIFKDRVLQIDPNKPDAQTQYNKLLQEFQPKAPSILGGLPTEFNANTQRSIITSHDDFIKLTTPQERDTVVDGRSGKGLFIFDPYSQTQRMVGGSFQGAPEKWSPVRGEKQEIIYYTNSSGTQMLSPEEYKTRMTQKEQPAEAPAARGQAGNFAAPTDVYNNVPMAQVKQGYARVESGSPQGNYAALGPVLKSGDRAYGKYQVMGANIPSWTKQALGRSMTPEEFLADSDAQEKVFENQFQRNFKKYGTLEDAASVWFSGRPLAQATKAGARDVNMGVPEYVQKVVGGMGPTRNVPTAPLTGVSPSLRGLTEQPVNAMAPPLPPMNAMAAPAQTPQFNAAPMQQPMAQAQNIPAPRAIVAAPPAIQTPEERQMRQLQFVKSAPIGKESQYQGKVSLENTLTDFANELSYLDSQGKAPSVRHGATKNAELSAEGSWLGQTWGRFTGTPAQSTRDAIESIRQNLVSIVAKAAGKTGQQMNYNFDVKNALKAIGDPKATVESLMATLNNLNKTFGTNAPIQGSPEFSESRRQIEAAKATQAMPEAAGIDPAAIKILMAQPETAAAFDAHFGVPGLAAKILGR
jgi:hypothetical protein